MGLLEKVAFITFEGGEGVGKSTQVRRLADWLLDRGRAVTVTREPGGTPGAECVRHVLLSGRAESLGTEMEAVLFAAARRDNVERMIRPAIDAGHVVLCDRYMDSSRVYQGAVGGVSDAFMTTLERAVTEGARPDLTLVFDLDVERSMERLAERGAGQGDRYERESGDAHERRREAFLELTAREPERCKLIRADRTPSDVFESVLDAVRPVLSGAENA